MRLFCVIAVLLSAAGSGLRSASVIPAAQCRAPLPPPSNEPNIFTVEQEEAWGDAVAERFEAYLRIIHSEPLAANLRRMGDRLVAHLPSGGLRVRLQLIDIPEANAFALPGGRIYVSRKLIGLTRSEDELAGIIGHELGHLVSRQQSIASTRQLKEVLGVTSLGDRKDVFDKHYRLMENAGRKPGSFGTDSHERADQLEADRLGLFLVSAAGYNPRALVDFWDRFARTGGNTGSFLSRVFGTTSPDARRLGELIKSTAAMPDCVSPTAPSSAAFRDWQLSIATAMVTSPDEKLPGLIHQTPLTPLRDRIRHVRFSPDGRAVLVQDDASISVLDREPFAFRFRIPTLGARAAEFSPDSTSVVLHTADLRVERWSIATKSIVDVFDLYWPKACLQSAVAPDGRTVACVDTAGDLTVMDAVSGRDVFQKKGFYQSLGFDELFIRLLMGVGNFKTSGSLSLQFSPGGHYFVAGYEGYAGSGVIAYDVAKRVAISLKDPARRLLSGTFTFIGPNKLAGLNTRDVKKSGVVSLPDGNVIDELALPPAALERAAQSRYAIVRPYETYPIGLFDLQAKQGKAGFETIALDVYNDHYVTDTGVGEIALYAVEGRKLVSSVKVEPSPITRVRTAAISQDFRWLALSATSRGAVWDLRGQLPVAYMRDFNGSFFDGDGMLYIDLPRAGADPRGIVKFDPQSRKVSPVSRLAPSAISTQFGRWQLHRAFGGLLTLTSAEFQVADVRSPKVLWARPYKTEPPSDYWFHPLSDALVLIWAADSPGGRTRIARDERLKSTVNRGDLKGDFLLEVVDAESGQTRGMALIETGKGSFHLDGVLVRGDRMFVTDSIGRVIAYSLSTGRVLGFAVGDTPVVSADGSQLAVSTGEGRVAVYDVGTMSLRSDLRFKHAVAFGAFSPDSASFFALTADHTAHAISMKK